MRFTRGEGDKFIYFYGTVNDGRFSGGFLASGSTSRALRGVVLISSFNWFNMAFWSWVGLLTLLWIGALLIIKKKQWRKLWPAALLGVAVLYIIDSTLIGLGAFRYSGGGVEFSGLPLVYLAAMLGGGPLAVHFYPGTNAAKIIYVLFLSGIFLIAEWIFILTGAMVHENWTLLHSYFLNIFGFVAVLWFSEKLRLPSRKQLL